MRLFQRALQLDPHMSYAGVHSRSCATTVVVGPVMPPLFHLSSNSFCGICLAQHLVLNVCVASAACFAERLSVDPPLFFVAVAASLAGHEQLANDDLAAAYISYQHALRCDSRHYHAL